MCRSVVGTCTIWETILIFDKFSNLFILNVETVFLSFHLDIQNVHSPCDVLLGTQLTRDVRTN